MHNDICDCINGKQGKRASKYDVPLGRTCVKYRTYRIAGYQERLQCRNKEMLLNCANQEMWH